MTCLDLLSQTYNLINKAGALLGDETYRTRGETSWSSRDGWSCGRDVVSDIMLDQLIWRTHLCDSGVLGEEVEKWVVAVLRYHSGAR